MGRRSTRSSLLAVALAIAALTASLLAPAVASAHPRFAEADPASNATIDQAPSEIRLEFTGPVVAPPGGVQVFSPSGEEVQVGSPVVDGTIVTQQIGAGPDGTWAVAWKLASTEDKHVISGSTTFIVGAAGGDAAAVSRNEARASRPLQAAFIAVRAVEFALVLLVAGAGLFACLVVPGWHPRLLLPGLVALVVVLGLGIVLHLGLLLPGGLGAAIQPDGLRLAPEVPFGRVGLVRILVVIIAIGPALVLRRATQVSTAARVAMTLVFAGVAGTVSITGHAVADGPLLLRLPLDAVHTVAAALWVGGLVQLVAMHAEAHRHRSDLARFGKVARGCLVVLVVTGLYAAWVETGLRPTELLESTYGRILLAKSLAIIGVLPFAWNSGGLFVPALATHPQAARRMLRQYVARELALLALVVALTAWLVTTSPAT